MTSCANLRCDNYSLKRTDFHSCKVIAGKIIAAIATTTAAGRDASSLDDAVHIAQLIVSSLMVNHFRLSFSVRVSDSGTVQTGATERYGCVHESPDRTGSQPLHFIHPRETRILRNQDRNNSSQ